VSEVLSNSYTYSGLLRAVDIRVGCAPSNPCALTSVQLVWVVGRLTKLGPWVGCSQCSPDSISRRTLYGCLDFPTFQTLAFWLPFLPSCFQSHIIECFNSSSCSFNINMNKNRMRYEKGINCLWLAVTKKTEFKSLCHATPDLVISQSSLSIKCEKI
jgi:hypothetical protein